MKKRFLFFGLFILVSGVGWAQNLLESTGPIGIGNTAPMSLLDVGSIPIPSSIPQGPSTIGGLQVRTRGTQPALHIGSSFYAEQTVGNSGLTTAQFNSFATHP